MLSNRETQMRRKQIWKQLPSSLALAVTFVLGTALWHGAFAGPSQKQQPLMLKEQGSFSVGEGLSALRERLIPPYQALAPRIPDSAFALISFTRSTRSLRMPELCRLS